jgi:hypothetical protein
MLQVVMTFSVPVLLSLNSSDGRILNEQLTQLMDELAKPSSSISAAYKLTYEYSAEVVVPLVVTALRNDARFEDRLVREAAYRILADHKAAQIPIGYEQLMTGVDEPEGRLSAIRGLGHTPENKQHEVVRKLIIILGERDVSDEIRVQSLGTLGWLQPQDPLIAEHLKPIFIDRNLSQRVRAMAAYALFRVGSTQSLIELAKQDDPIGLKAVLGVLAGSAGQPPAGFKVDAQQHKAARRFARECLRNEYAEVRKFALEMAPQIYGRDLKNELKQGGNILFEELRSAVEQAAVVETDPQNRQKAEDCLKGLEQTKAYYDSKRQANTVNGANDKNVRPKRP